MTSEETLQPYVGLRLALLGRGATYFTGVILWSIRIPFAFSKTRPTSQASSETATNVVVYTTPAYRQDEFRAQGTWQNHQNKDMSDPKRSRP